MLEPMTITIALFAAIIAATVVLPIVTRMPAVEARKGEDGAITFEYVLIVAGIGALAIVIITFLFNFLQDETQEVVTNFDNIEFEDRLNN